MTGTTALKQKHLFSWLKGNLQIAKRWVRWSAGEPLWYWHDNRSARAFKCAYGNAHDHDHRMCYSWPLLGLTNTTFYGAFVAFLGALLSLGGLDETDEMRFFAESKNAVRGFNKTRTWNEHDEDLDLEFAQRSRSRIYVHWIPAPAVLRALNMTSASWPSVSSPSLLEHKERPKPRDSDTSSLEHKIQNWHFREIKGCLTGKARILILVSLLFFPSPLMVPDFLASHRKFDFYWFRLMLPSQKVMFMSWLVVTCLHLGWDLGETVEELTKSICSFFFFLFFLLLWRYVHPPEKK